MAKYKVAPTKTNLFKVKRDLQFAQEGYDLLEQKREILIAELMSLVDRTKDAQRKVGSGLADAFYALEQSVIRMGRRTVAQTALAVNVKASISLSHRSVMGVEVPIVKTVYKDIPPYYSFAGTSFWLDEAIDKFKNVLKIMGELAELRLSLLRLAREVKRTVRRVNALEKIALPDYKETVKYIQDVLEEQERESFFVLKLVKARLQNKHY